MGVQVLALKLIQHKVGQKSEPWAGQPGKDHTYPSPQELRRWPFFLFHSAWRFCFFAFEPSSFHGVSKLPTIKLKLHLETSMDRGCLMQMRNQPLVLWSLEKERP